AHLQSRQIQTALFILEMSPLADARDMLIYRAYEGAPAFTHVLSVDSDMEFTPSDVDRLIALNTDVAGHVYPKRANQGFVVHIEKSGSITIAKGVAKVAGVGMGLTLIARSVFEKLSPVVDVQIIGGLRMPSYFQPIVENDERLSDDYSFCKRWR